MSSVAHFIKVHPDAIIPTRGTNQSVGYDLSTIQQELIRGKEVKLIHTGLVTKPPMGYFWEIYIRSSVPTKKYPGLVLANSVGIIDPDYSNKGDEIKIAVYNTTSKNIVIPKHIKIAQMVLRQVCTPEIEEVFSFDDYPFYKKRSRGGFGATDKKEK